MTKILDCTIRDGGYYNNWDFTDQIINDYINATNNLPIDYIEVGYLSKAQKEYKGKFFYLNEKLVKTIKDSSNKHLAVMIDIKNIQNVNEIVSMVSGLNKYITLIRLASSINQIELSIKILKLLKKQGFEVAINLMRVSEINFNKQIMDKLKSIENSLDYLYLVDSYGSVLPTKIKDDIKKIKKYTKIKIGFHGHNNMELALANTISSIESGAEIVDATITGMGRGAGNLKLELLLVYLSSFNQQSNLFFNSLSSIVESFEILKKQYKWGTSLPYMISGAFSQPQQNVMDLIQLNRYSFDSLINNLTSINNIKYPELKIEKKYKKVVLIGGGESVALHSKAIIEFIKGSEFLMIYCTSKFLDLFEECKSDKIFSVSGDETLKFNSRNEIFKFITSPFPRKNNPIQNSEVEIEELKEINFIDQYHDSSLVIALQLVINLEIDSIFMVGFDGYKNLNSKNSILNTETQDIIKEFSKIQDLISLTKTDYKYLTQRSIYEY